MAGSYHNRSMPPVYVSEALQHHWFQMEHRASDPEHQFADQIRDETSRMVGGDPNRTLYPIIRAYETVHMRWVEQGIWNSKWHFSVGNCSLGGLWKHQEPLEPELELETDPEIGPPSPPSFFFPKPPLKPRRAKSVDERKREREASRPYHQFVYQISKEREWIQEESATGEGAADLNINTRAYKNVKNTWTKRQIWNKRWGVLPGMWWKHEQPFEDWVRETANLPSSPAYSTRYEAPVAPPFGSPSPLWSNHRQVSGALNSSPGPATISVKKEHSLEEAPVVPFWGSPSPGQSNHRQVSGDLNSLQQGPPVDIASARSENGDAERSPSAPRSPHTNSGKRVLRVRPGQVLLPSKRKASDKDRQPVDASLGPAHSSKVATAARGRRGLQRRRKNLQNASSGGLRLSSDVDAAEPQPLPSPDRVTLRRSKRLQLPDRITPRRSKRLQLSVPSISKDPTGTASSIPSKRAVRSKSEQKVAKPQGVSKRQPAKTTGGKARKS